VRKSGRRVRVTAQLIRADTNHHIMAERYDRDLTDLFELQDEIVTAIAGAIQPELLKFERERIADWPQQSEDAYELYQRAVWQPITGTPRQTMPRRKPTYAAPWRSTRNIRRPPRQWRSPSAMPPIWAGRKTSKPAMPNVTSWPSARSVSMPAIPMPISR
jgi:hypothetical protein